MNPSPSPFFSRTARGFLRRTLQSLALLLGLSAAASPADDSATEPTIRGIRLEGTNVLVNVYSPETLKRITLETRPRLGTGNWVARDFAWPDGHSGEFTFTLPNVREVELIRVKGDDARSLPLPTAFYKGQSFFDTLRVNSSAVSIGIADGANPETGGAGVGVSNQQPPQPPNTETTSTSTAGGPRQVAESDIWQLDGSTLYFFNQNRGLQIIDVTHPDAPRILGQLPLASVGEQMYLLPEGAGSPTRYVALLTREGCSWNSGSVVIVRIDQGVPTEQARLKVSAQIRESRLVGDALYVATQGWIERRYPSSINPKGEVIPESVTWENTTTIESFDLADPAHPIARPTVALAANPNAISATDRFLFVAITGSEVPQAGRELPEWARAGAQSILVFDISDPHGHVSQLSSIPTAGQVADKFKLNLQGDVLAVVSQTAAIWNQNTFRPTVTQIETFSLGNPLAPSRIGHLPIITNETVYATRFDGPRAYVVTFRQIDPLWIIDLSNPSQPTIRGELHIPGWSTYIHPMGDRLIAMGQENWGQPSVSLYDVADATTPKLLSRVALGTWAWSEANNDEKAFKVLPEAGMILVPWSGQRTNRTAGNYFQGMQLVDFDRDGLNLRGVIEHTFQARRATLHQQRILSLSGTELITADFADRDHPTIKATLDLAPQTDRVFSRGENLVSIAFANGTQPTLVRIAPKTNPDLFLSSLSLSNRTTVGLDLQGRILQIVEKENESYHTEERLQTNDVVRSIPQPPLIGFTTNVVVQWIDQPTLISYRTNEVVRLEFPPRKIIGSNWVEVIVHLPPIPGGPVNQTLTNRYLRPVYDDPQPVEVTHQEVVEILTPQPPVLVTNLLVKKLEIPQPPLLQTNQMVYTNVVWIRDPLFGWLTLVDVDATPHPVVLGQTRFEFQSEYYGTWLQALWPNPETVVWAPAGSESNRGYPYPVFLGDALPSVGIGVLSPGLCFNCGWDAYYSSGPVPELMAFDVRNPADPVLISRVKPTIPPDSGFTWAGTSPMHVANGKIFFSHSFSRYVPPTQTTLSITNTEGIVIPVWQYGVYEYTHWLDVVNYAEPTTPVLTPAASLPGALQGISHNGSLLYAKVKDTNSLQSIAALAHDGAQAFLVDSIPLGTAWQQPSLVLDSGHVLIPRMASTNTELSSIETWQLNGQARFERVGIASVVAPVQELRAFGALVSATGTDSTLQLFDASRPELLGSPRTYPLDCSYWFNLGTATGSLTEGLWIPRGIQGVWHLTGPSR